jgi:hypothetical protein
MVEVVQTFNRVFFTDLQSAIEGVMDWYDSSVSAFERSSALMSFAMCAPCAIAVLASYVAQLSPADRAELAAAIARAEAP